MPWFGSGGFTSSIEGETPGDFFSQLPQAVGAIAQSVTAVISAVKGQPPPPIRFEADIGAGVKQTALGAGVLAGLIGVAILWMFLSRN